MPFYTGLRFAQTWREGHLAFHSTYAGTQQCVPVFVAEKSSLGRGTGWNFRTLVDMPPAHAGLLRKIPVWIVGQAGISVPWSICHRRMPVCRLTENRKTV